MREVTDARVHGTTGEPPALRFARDEAVMLKPIAAIGPFLVTRDLARRVGADCAVEVDGVAYSVPWRLIGERIRVVVSGGMVRIAHAGQEVAVQAVSAVRRSRIVDPVHFRRRAGTDGRPVRIGATAEDVIAAAPPSDLRRPLADYEALVGGSWLMMPDLPDHLERMLTRRGSNWLLEQLRPGDVVAVTKNDCLSRSLQDLLA